LENNLSRASDSVRASNNDLPGRRASQTILIETTQGLTPRWPAQGKFHREDAKSAKELGQVKVAPDFDAPATQSMGQARRIRRFQQARLQGTVHLEHRIHHQRGDLVGLPPSFFSSPLPFAPFASSR
jgi:hypothetical protein